ncbi:MAG: hypothetical protein P8L45_09775, partial [Longimicrobiales bacterium]|nr:hypothetical protein [Longimicrobiales bacterium]
MVSVPSVRGRPNRLGGLFCHRTRLRLNELVLGVLCRLFTVFVSVDPFAIRVAWAVVTMRRGNVTRAGLYAAD